MATVECAVCGRAWHTVEQARDYVSVPVGQAQVVLCTDQDLRCHVVYALDSSPASLLVSNAACAEIERRRDTRALREVIAQSRAGGRR